MKRATPVLAAILTVALWSGTVPARAQTANTDRAVTVVAVVDGGGFTPYHYDFLGHQHPWNRDADPDNDFDFTVDPSSYIEGHPGGTPIEVTIPTHDFEKVDRYRSDQDAEAWDGFMSSTADDVNIHWFPGTKIIGAVSFRGGSEPFYGDNEAHGTRSAISAAGNLRGTCPECLFVLVRGSNAEALAWAASQPWIDVVTNSYGHGMYGANDPAHQDPTGRVPGGAVRDNIWFDAPLNATREASEDGQFVVFSAGNGLVNAFDVPMVTYWSSEKGPDWVVTVGAVSPAGKQTASGSGKPVDVSSIGSNYPSSGGFFANGGGFHSGTSNASPVVGGYLAHLIQETRELFGDTTSGHAGGVVAEGQALVCGFATPDCALGDGVLTRREVEDVVLGSALPSEATVDAPLYPTWPTTDVAYAYQGRGVLAGRIDGADAYEAEAAHIVHTAAGLAAPYERPPGEDAWFHADSKCRQRVWGSWTGGLYTDGASYAFDPATDLPAVLLDAACTPLPDGLLATLGTGS